jgi:O-acetyl-ADP-ribose deacetylase
VIEVVRGRLVEARAEAILRPVGSDLQAVTAAGRELDLQAGESVRQRLSALGEIPVGGAVVTPGGGVEVPFLIHAVVQSRDEPPSTAAVRLALTNGLRRAAEWEIGSLALPPLGTGVGQMEAEGAARAMLALLQEQMAVAGYPARVTVVAPGPYEEEVFRAVLEGSA